MFTAMMVPIYFFFVGGGLSNYFKQSPFHTVLCISMKEHYFIML